MIRDMPADKFEKLSGEQQKRYISALLIKESGALPVPDDETPVAFVMAGVPGSGKTEFLNSIKENISASSFSAFAHLDLDQIVTVFPEYTPKTYAKFRNRGNGIVARCFDELRKGRFNMMIDGTFSGLSGASIRNVEKLIDGGYIVIMVYMFDNPETSWDYTKKREIETSRGINRIDFVNSCMNVSVNLQKVVEKFKDHPRFSLQIVKQKILRNKEYEFISEPKDIDIILEQGYNIDRLKEIL